MEIVSEPDMRTGAEAAAYGAEIRRIVRFIGAGNGNMQVRLPILLQILLLNGS